MSNSSTGTTRRSTRIQTFSFTRPDQQKAPRAEIELCGNENVRGVGHVILQGESNGLHYESGADEFWIVLSGRARFCGSGRILIGEFGVNDGILIPRNTEYLIENIGPDALELIQVAAVHRGADDRRVDLAGGLKRGTVERHSGRAL
jgi:mannose-6-phosphate isomerase-like protein (cupin superfamily)